MKLYNLFPLLSGQFSAWKPHIDRAAEMEFDWIFVNPIQKTGQSGSLYSIADYFELNPLLVDTSIKKKPDDQLKEVIQYAEEKHGIRMMVDLVINHCAVDSEVIKKHPHWFKRDHHGNVENPFCIEDDGKKVVWHDLARFDHQHTADPEGLYQFFFKIIEHFVKLGFKGFRCDAAYQIPQDLWRRLIGDIKKKYPGTIFAAETLGCPADATKKTAGAGFDYIFNSSKWWDYSSPWLMEQYHLTRECVPSISFPESHDTARLFQESHDNVQALKQRYLFSAFFSSGVMMPIGFEYGFKKALHVVNTRPGDWESQSADLVPFISHINKVKAKYKVFQEDGPINIISDEHSPILFFWKASQSCQEEALIIINKDIWNKQYFSVDNLYKYIQMREPLVDLSPEYPQDYVPEHFEFELHPGMARVLLSSRSS